MAAERRELQRRWAAVVDGDVAGVGERAAERVRRPRAGVALVGLPLGRRPDRRSVDADAVRPRRIPARARRLPRRRQPTRQGCSRTATHSPAQIAARTTAELGPARRACCRRAAASCRHDRAHVPRLRRRGRTSSWSSGPEPAPPGTRAVQHPPTSSLDDDGQVTDRAGSFRLPLAELLFLPIFVSADPQLRSRSAATRRGPRRRSGARSIRRATLDGAGERARRGRARRPGRLGASTAACRDACSPARRSSASRCSSTSKAPSLRRVLAPLRRATAAERGAAARRMQFTEMLPGPRGVLARRARPGTTRANCDSSPSTSPGSATADPRGRRRTASSRRSGTARSGVKGKRSTFASVHT